ncbi:DEAD/DEAH box helicase [[Clostridium] dakarense]|uniref:DEAD/DEAH box helicase n=1 Tax=Faecalimicrobium dakarense TaxID=1301100 RepID=UPI0004B45D30|nr:DEAD/DEAH box helicase [[Clostridium] dakarense]
MTESNKLIINSQKQNLLNELQSSLKECKSFYFSVAFVNFSGIQLLLDTFKELEQKGVEGKIITSTYLNFTDPKALDKIRSFNNIDLKVFITNKEIGFHTKVYIFENEDNYKVIIGSSNLTQSALKSNIEWNVEVISKEEAPFIQDVLREYNKLWEISENVDNDFLTKYEDFIKQLKGHEKTKNLIFENYKTITPNSMQSRAMENLERLREHGEDKALVIAATGTGKTYMSAFDVREYNPEKILFLVHRGEILSKSKETFEKLIKNKASNTGLFTGNAKEKDADYLFSTIQTMHRHFTEFEKDNFDYIIIDEAHHASSRTYLDVLDYFEPKFTLGMTATPERSDNNSIFDLFDNNVALEVRLHEALEEELIIPFHYFGVTDIDGVDLSNIDIDNIAEITKKLKVNERVDFIIDKMNFYGHDGEYRKCLGFCVSIEHAEFMASEFNKRGIKSACLSGSDSPAKREEYIKRLEDNNDDLEVIFTVDIFNEGVDIPSVNSVLMLRPTNSPIIFIQQLGRGLRKHESKEFLTVLDFIGNHSKTFLIAIALNGSRYYDKDSLKVAVATGFANVPGCTHIQIDEISKERILEQIDSENFRSMKYLKEEYNEFKIMNNGKIPYLLLDYIKYEGSPDPIKFIDKEKTYIGFVAKMEKDDNLKALLENSNFESALKELCSKLPLKRVYEFAILKYLLKHDNITLEKAKSEILKYMKHVDDDSVVHSFEYLNQNYYDSVQLKGKLKLVDYLDDTLSRSKEFGELLNDSEYRKYIEDVINYGIFRYEKEFKEEYYGVPFFKLYEQYQMIDAALLSNYRKIHSSFRGSGLLTNGNDYFLFVDLHKDEGIEDRINYKDKFISERYFQWQSPNATRQDSDRGKNIIFNKDRDVNLHLFARKYRELDGKSEPFIYLGKGDTVEYEGEKPITVKLKLESEVPVSIYREFFVNMLKKV